MSECQTRATSSSCENFQTISDGKKGYGMIITKSTPIIFSCFIPKESKDYDNAKSCFGE
jgi:hypothetical protein